MGALLSGRPGKTISEPACLLLDVREEWEYRFVRFPAAVHIPMSRLPENLHRIPKDRLVIVYCHTGIRSLLACYLLVQNGFQSVRNLEGGIDEFARAVEPALPRYCLEEGRRPPESVLAENARGVEKKEHNPWGEGVSDSISL
ncbi:MAG: rhodanese-like domain-containing protein [Nitrospirae bacterium]|nr:rhodanese-like domain-containing protein [Nitrospirota bacterium]MCL5285534.1 rhodanese-like domain-containing protein [Nitrospirota bacterium]